MGARRERSSAAPSGDLSAPRRCEPSSREFVHPSLAEGKGNRNRSPVDAYGRGAFRRSPCSGCATTSRLPCAMGPDRRCPVLKPLIDIVWVGLQPRAGAEGCRVGVDPIACNRPTVAQVAGAAAPFALEAGLPGRSADRASKPDWMPPDGSDRRHAGARCRRGGSCPGWPLCPLGLSARAGGHQRARWRCRRSRKAPLGARLVSRPRAVDEHSTRDVTDCERQRPLLLRSL